MDAEVLKTINQASLMFVVASHANLLMRLLLAILLTALMTPLTTMIPMMGRPHLWHLRVLMLLMLVLTTMMVMNMMLLLLLLVSLKLLLMNLSVWLLVFDAAYSLECHCHLVRV